MKLDLAEMKKRWTEHTVLAVTLESGRLAVDVVRREGEAGRVERSFALPVGAEAVLAEPEKTGRELAAELAAAGVREKRCVVCLPAGWALTTSTDVPELTGEDLRGYLELRAEREFPIAVTDLRLAHCAYALPDGTQRVTLAGIPVKRMEAIEKMLAAAGCKAVSISLGLEMCRPEAGAAAALHFLANGNHVDVVIAAGGGIAGLRSLPGPLGANAADFDAAGFSREVRITLGRLPEAVRQQLHEARFGGTPASAENLCLEIRQHLRRMGLDSRLEKPAWEEKDEHPGAALDAARLHLREKPVVFEFLPPQVNRWQTMFQQFDSSRRRWIIGAAIGLVVLPVLTFFIRSRIESSLEAEWKEMQKPVAELETLQQKIRQFRPWFETTPQTLRSLESLVGAFPETGEVWAKTVQVSDEFKITCSGSARSQAALQTFFERLSAQPDVVNLQRQQVRGDNPILFSFTYKWEPKDAK